MSHTSKISDAKNSESLSRDDDSLSQFSEGVGENKMQVNQRKVSFGVLHGPYGTIFLFTLCNKPKFRTKNV